MTMEPENLPLPTAEIIARPANYYRFTRFIMVAAMLIYGALSIKDGFVVYPAANAAAQKRGLEDLPHPGDDIPLNKILGVTLPPLALLVLVWTLYRSRGEYRLDGSVLHVPGHPPLPLEALRTIDRGRWDRKGIARIEYQLPGSDNSEWFTLDDFIYERGPTDAIFVKLEASFAPATTEPAVPSETTSDSPSSSSE